MNMTPTHTLQQPLTKPFGKPFMGWGVTTSEVIERAQQRPIDGPCREYALMVRRLLGYYPSDRRPFLSLRAAEGKTGVKHTTIGTMARGFRADEFNTRRFAEKLGGDPDSLLALAGYYREAADRTSDDPLSRIGLEFDLRQFDHIPVSNLPASAGWPRGTGDQTEEPAARRIPSEVRGIEVQGDCMEPFLHDKDVVFIRPQQTAENGQKVIALLQDDSITCKVYRADDGHPYLEATNGKYPRISNGFSILGVVVKVLRDV